MKNIASLFLIDFFIIIGHIVIQKLLLIDLIKVIIRFSTGATYPPFRQTVSRQKLPMCFVLVEGLINYFFMVVSFQRNINSYGLFQQRFDDPKTKVFSSELSSL